MLAAGGAGAGVDAHPDVVRGRSWWAWSESSDAGYGFVDTNRRSSRHGGGDYVRRLDDVRTVVVARAVAPWVPRSSVGAFAGIGTPDQSAGVRDDGQAVTLCSHLKIGRDVCARLIQWTLSSCLSAPNQLKVLALGLLQQPPTNSPTRGVDVDRG